MSREVSADFNELKKFIENYNLSKTYENTEFIKTLSKQHKKYFAILTLLSELKHQKVTPVDASIKAHKEMNTAFINYTAECVSDLGIALFAWIHGAYKAARQVLRSCIENFLKGVGSIEKENITKLKNVYEVIDSAGDISFFRNPENKKMFDSLKSIYGLLCADTHTATFQNMAHISALGYFPNFDQKKASQFEELFNRVSIIFTSVLCLIFKSTFRKIHYKNKDIISTALSANIRKELNS